MNFLAEVGQILGEPLPYEATLQRVCDAAVRTVADAATMYLYVDGQLQLVAAAHVVADQSEQLRRRAALMLRDPRGPRAWLESIVRKGTGVLASRVDETSVDAFAASPEHAGYLRDAGVRSFVIVPLITQQPEVLGVLGLVYTDESGLHYDEEALIVAEDLARRCAAAIAKAKLHETAVNVSKQFQLAALPKLLPRIPGIQLDSFYEPASSAMLVGGDWFDAFELPNRGVGFTVGDVSGHGVEAAVVMGNLRNALRIAMMMEPDLTKVLRAADRLVSQQIESAFATANIAVLDTNARTLSCVAAGHPGPLCWYESGRIVTDPFLDRGLPLGFRDMALPQDVAQKIDLEDCSFVVFFTDGLVEAERDYVAGEAKLTQAIAQQSIRESKHPARMLRLAVAPERHPDDLAVMTLRVT
ncbi:MAG TPA: SpoIIE family protein phosphatase [Candidatus Baltobacteraceae bacterium]|nr:SpoIIE family protein phosphatase [Candidatus Baltobacteraceae bacterium]